MRRRGVAGLLAAAALVGLVAAAWAVAKVIDGDPDLGVALVDGDAMESCLRDAPEPAENWRIATQRSPGANDISVSWGTRDGELPKSGAGLMVLPSRGGAEQMDSLMPETGPDEAGSGHDYETWGNVLVSRGDGDAYPGPPGAVSDLLRDCAERAATMPPRAEGGFSECDPPTTAGVVEWMTVRGLSCDEARRVLARGFGAEGYCEGFGHGVACAGTNICCSLFAHYVGSGEFEIVYKTGI